MDNLLEKINSPDDLKKLTVGELPALSEEIRQFILSSLSKTGGHLASNLGIIELTVSLHYVFDFKPINSSGTSATSATLTKSSPADAKNSHLFVNATASAVSRTPARALTTSSGSATPAPQLQQRSV